MEPFQIQIGQGVLADLQRRLDVMRLPSSIQTGWQDGTNLDYLRTLLDYWRTEYDWRLQEKYLNSFPRYISTAGESRLHFIHQRGTGPNPMPLLLAHGWPDSSYRFHKLIPLLTDPGAHGADPADAFHIVAPDMPGYGFSPRGLKDHVFEFGDRYQRLMTEELGYTRFGGHGGDVGSGVVERMARNHPANMLGIHLTDVGGWHAQQPPTNLSPAESEYIEHTQRFFRESGAYLHMQGSKPWTPAAGLNDSPAGLASWIVEKFYAWSDCRGNVETRFTKDELITNLMLYWVTESIGTSFLTYLDSFKPGPEQRRSETEKEAANTRQTPAGFALFPHDIATPPREWAERFFNVQRWKLMPEGGHFAAMEVPELLAKEIRSFFRPLRDTTVTTHQ